MVRCLAAFLDFCYLVRRNSICVDTLAKATEALDRFHEYRQIFIDTGVEADIISLPRQHSLKHYLYSVELFGSPNGLCSSITESKHIKAVKRPWRRSSRYHALHQMLLINERSDKLTAARSRFAERGMMQGTTLSYTAMLLRGEEPQPFAITVDPGRDDHGAVSGPKVMSSVSLAATAGMCASKYNYNLFLTLWVEREYPKYLKDLAAYIDQPRLPDLIRRFLFNQLHPDNDVSGDDISLDQCPYFSGRVFVYHSAIARFYAPSDLCGAGGMHHERIRSVPLWQGEHSRRDTVFIVTKPDKPRMEGMCIGRVHLFFSFIYEGQYYPCALIHWFVPVGHSTDDETGLWVVKPEFTENGRPHLAVIHLDCIARAAHLTGVYGSSFLPDDFDFSFTLDVFRSYFVNSYADHHMHEFLT